MSSAEDAEVGAKRSRTFSDEQLEANRLLQKVARLDAFSRAILARHEEDGRGGFFGAKPFGQFVAAHLRHFDVGQITGRWFHPDPQR